MASVFHFHQSLGRKGFLPLLLAALFAAFSIMTKGIFAIIPIAAAVAGELIIKKDWKMLFNFRWVIAFLLISAFISPELYALYTQFDLHPEKVVFGRTNVSGLGFFFWDSQFGRFLNTGPITKPNGNIFFYFHTILWAYLPWSFLLYYSIFHFFHKNFKQPSQVEWYCISGSMATLFIFSISKFQLPFYITIVFPFFSILCAKYMYNVRLTSSIKTIRLMQIGVSIIMMVLIVALHYFFRPVHFSSFAVFCLCIPVLLFFVIHFTKGISAYRIFYQVCTVSIFVNLYFNLVYYPNLLKYQADSEAAFWVNAHNPAHYPLVQTIGYPFSFYADSNVSLYREGEEGELPQQPFLLYTETSVVDKLIEKGFRIKRLKVFDNFRITKVNGKFLNAKTRDNQLSTREIILVN